MLNRLNNGFLIFFLFLLFFASPVRAEEISAEVSVDRSAITVGDPVLYRLVIRYNPSLEITHPKLAKKLKEFEIRDYHSLPVREEEGMMVEEVQYLLTLFEVGTYEIPPLEIHYTGKEQKSITTPALKLEVKAVNTESIQDIRDIKGPLDIFWNWRPLAKGAGLLIAVLVAGWAVYYMVRRWREGRKNLVSGKPELVLSPEEEALQALKRLQESGIENIKTFYSEISDILRCYVGRLYQFGAVEQTSEEVEEHLKYKDIAEKPFAMVKDILIESDLVKFAKHVPSEKAAEEIFPQMEKIVESTKPKPFTETILKADSSDTTTAG